MKTSKPLNFILIGRSGCGKGTQGKLLMEKFGAENFFYVSTGDLFRSLSQCDTAAGKRVKKVLEEGGLPFDVLATTLWMHEISFKMKEDQGLVADGFPRRLDEAKNLDSFLEFLGRKENTFYLLIDISRQEAFDRLTKRRICKACNNLIPWVGEFKKLTVCNKCQGELVNRPDDRPEAINNRLDYYEQRVMEVINYYSDKGVLLKINGEQPIEVVFQEILNSLKIQ